MTDNSPYTKFKAKLREDNSDTIAIKQSASKISNAVCIENLVKNSSLFAPSRLEPMNMDKPLKAIYNLKQLKYKKQIEPHQSRNSGCFVGKSMSSLMTDKKAEQKYDRHKRNVSAAWQNNKKYSKDRATQYSNNQAPTASFYLKKGDIPLFYELKMNIKKVESCLKPAEGIQKKIMRSKYRNRNLPINSEKITGDLPSISNKEWSQAKQSIQMIKHTEITQVKIQPSKFSLPLKSQCNKQRYIKSTLIQYASKSNLKSSKEPIQLTSELQHIKNLLKLNAEQLHEERIKLIDADVFAVSNLSERTIREGLDGRVSANCLSVCHFDQRTQVITSIFSREPNRRVEIASLTKIMTCYLILNIAAAFNLDIFTEKMLVSERASKMIGTSAGLGYSDTLTIYELLHALMLPSGNDAATTLAEWGGKTIRKYVAIAQKYSTNTIESKTINFVSELIIEKKSHQKLFVWHMNRAAMSLKLRNTRFMNPHGLMNDKASSSASDVAVLTCLAMQHEIFAEIVSKRQFSCKVFNRTYSQTRNTQWRNTNKLLNNEGFIGVKTGVTPSAGPCLASMFQINERECLVVVVLRTRSMESRFKQSLELVKQGLNALGLENVSPSVKKPAQDDQQTDASQENDKGEEANLVLDQKQSNSDQEMQQDEEDQS